MASLEFLFEFVDFFRTLAVLLQLQLEELNLVLEDLRVGEARLVDQVSAVLDDDGVSGVALLDLFPKSSIRGPSSTLLVRPGDSESHSGLVACSHRGSSTVFTWVQQPSHCVKCQQRLG